MLSFLYNALFGNHTPHSILELNMANVPIARTHPPNILLPPMVRPATITYQNPRIYYELSVIFLPFNEQPVDHGPSVYEIGSDDEDEEAPDNDEEVKEPCPICLQSMQGKPSFVLPCSTGKEQHKFHLKCLKRLIHMQRTCPICRAPIQHDIEMMIRMGNKP